MTAVREMLPSPPPLVGIDPYLEEVVSDPYPFFTALRDTASVVALEKYGVYSTGRYEEIRHILGDWENFSSAAGVGIQDTRKPGKFRIPIMLVEEDPPKHTIVRSTMTRLLSPKVVRDWRGIFEREAEVAVTRILDMKSFDAMGDFVERYIFKVFAEAIGLDLPYDPVSAISEMRLNQSGPDNPLYERAMKKAEPYLDWFERSVERSGLLPGSVAEQLYLAEERGEIPEGVAKNMTRTLVGGGIDTTMTGLGSCMFYLAQSPGQMALATAQPEIMRGALDEGSRLESPFRVLYRTTTRDMEFSGFHLEKDQKVGLWLGAGNRDPRKWEKPDEFDMTRKSAGVHLAFGHGIHVCVGQMVARLEAECLLTEFARRVKTVEIDGQVERRPMNTMCSFKKIPLRVTAH